MWRVTPPICHANLIKFNLRSGVFFFFSRADEARGKKKSRERHKGIIGRGHDLRLDQIKMRDYMDRRVSQHVPQALLFKMAL